MGHECYYCDQVFESKEKLFDHLEVHAETQEKQEIKKKEKVLKKKLSKTMKKDNSHTKKISDENPTGS